MSEYIDIYIDTTTKVPEDATEFDHELFERFMSGGPWVAHSEYMKLKADNAKLVDVLHEVETEAVYAYNCLQQDCMTTANSSEHFFKKWWHAECELDRVKDENAKLREQIHWLKKGDILHVLTDQECIDQCERERLMQVSIDALDKDNAKLRELVQDMWFWHYEGHIDSESQERQMLHIDAVIQRMRELGVDTGDAID